MNERCIEWEASRFTHGYGRFRRNRQTTYAHRWAWEKFYGPIPVGMMVCHHCDNPPCVNPTHLFIGTCKDNLSDMSRKGRSANQRKTHCRHGHDLTNVEPRYSGHRICPLCDLARKHRKWMTDPVKSRAKSRAYYARTAETRRRQKRESMARLKEMNQ